MMDDKRPMPWLFWVGLAIMLPISYVLSIGPALWLDERGYLPGPLFMAVYEPLFAAAIHYGFGHSLAWYLTFWVTP